MSFALITLRTWLSTWMPDGDDDRGASVVEYALLVAFIAVICAVAISILGGVASTSYSSTADGFAS